MSRAGGSGKKRDVGNGRQHLGQNSDALANSRITASVTTGFAPPAPRPVSGQPTRPVLFFPDSSVAELQLDGVAFVSGAWRHGWFPVCFGPRGQYLPVALRYRVAGLGIDLSRNFEIGPGPTPLYLQVKTGSASGATWGFVAAALGGAMFVGGAFTAWIAGFCGGDGSSCEATRTQAVLLSVSAVGAMALVIGPRSAFETRPPCQATNVGTKWQLG